MRYQKMVKIKDTQFCVKNLKMKRKKNKNFLTFLSGDSNPRFSVFFPPMIWIFTKGEGDKIKSKQASKRDRTLPSFNQEHSPWKEVQKLMFISESRVMKLMKKKYYIHDSNAGAVFAHATTSRRRRMIPRNWDFLSPK